MRDQLLALAWVDRIGSTGRHFTTFEVGSATRKLLPFQAWLGHTGLGAGVEQIVLGYFERIGHGLVNTRRSRIEEVPGLSAPQ